MFKYDFNRLEELYTLAKQFGLDTKQPVSTTLEHLDILDDMIWNHWMFNDPNETEIEKFINEHFVLKMFRNDFHTSLNNILSKIDDGYRQYQLGMVKYDEAINIAKLYGLEQEVEELLNNGFTPDEALKEWDLL